MQEQLPTTVGIQEVEQCSRPAFSSNLPYQTGAANVFQQAAKAFERLINQWFLNCEFSGF